jgi:hypothetical protein
MNVEACDANMDDFTRLVRLFARLKEGTLNAASDSGSESDTEDEEIPDGLIPLVEKLVSGAQKSERRLSLQKPEDGASAALLSQRRKTVADAVSLQSSQRPTLRSPSTIDRTQFTFSMMIHSLYNLDDWAAKVNAELDASRKSFRSLAEPEDGKTEPRRRAISSSVDALSARNKALGIPAAETFESNSDLSYHEWRAKALKKRCTGRRQSVCAVEPMESGWVYDWFASSADNGGTKYSNHPSTMISPTSVSFVDDRSMDYEGPVQQEWRKTAKRAATFLDEDGQTPTIRRGSGLN